jgi:hypothetical protein
MTTDADRLIAAVNEALQPATAYRDPTPIPAIGPTPPVAQPGRPPMSQKATDASTIMLAAGVAFVPIGGSLSLVLYALGHVDPVVVGVVSIGSVLVLGGVAKVVSAIKAAVEAAPAEQHHHYSGPVSQQHHTVNTQTRGLIAKTTNNGS